MRVGLDLENHARPPGPASYSSDAHWSAMPLGVSPGLETGLHSRLMIGAKTQRARETAQKQLSEQPPSMDPGKERRQSANPQPGLLPPCSIPLSQSASCTGSQSPIPGAFPADTRSPKSFPWLKLLQKLKVCEDKNASHNTVKPPHLCPHPVTPTPTSNHTRQCKLWVKVWAQELGCLGLNPSSAL